MSEIESYQPQGMSLLPRDARRAGRSMSRTQSGGIVRTGRVDIETDVTLAKADSTTTVTGSMMADVVRVAQAQRQMELMAPEASGRLAMLADTHVLELMDLAADHRRALRRF